MAKLGVLKAWRLLVIVAASIATASLAQAQVAAPSLIPFTFFTSNPAVMQWGAPSRMGASISQFQNTTSPATVTDNFQMYGGGARGVWESFSIAAEGSHAESSNKPNGYSETADYYAGGLAVRLGRSIALGIGQEHSEQGAVGTVTVAGISTNVNVTSTTDSPVAGASIKIGDWFFLGAAVGQDQYKLTDAQAPSNNLSLSGDVYKYGVGIRTGGGVLTHFEYYEVHRPDFLNSTSTLSLRKVDRTGVAEINIYGFLLAYSHTRTDFDSLASPRSTDQDNIAVGYAPYTGLTVVLSGTNSVSNYPSGSTQSTATTAGYGLAITYLFGD